jgi:hypothetical protein
VVNHPQEGQLLGAGTVYFFPGQGLQNALANSQPGEDITIDDFVSRAGSRSIQGDRPNGRLGDNGIALIPAGTDANNNPRFHIMLGAQFYTGDEDLNDTGCTFALCNQTLNGMPLQNAFVREVAPTWVEGNANEQYLGAGMFSGPRNVGIRDEYGNFYVYPITSQQQE